MGLIACALEMVYRANRGSVALSFQEIGDSILPLFVEMIRWSAARRKDIRMSEHINSIHKKVSAPASAMGTMHDHGNATMHGGGNMNMNMNMNMNNINIGHSSNHSLISILKTDTIPENPSPPISTPLRSNVNQGFTTRPTGTYHLPDKLPRNIPEDAEFTIELIPNGTDIQNTPFVPAPLPTLPPLSENKQGEVQDSNTESTAGSDETDGGNLPSPEQSPVRNDFISEGPRQRQVRFSDAVDAKKSPHPGPVIPERLPTNANVMGSKEANIGNIEQPPAHWKKEKYTHPLAVLKLLKILRYFSRVLSAMVPMAHFPGLLDELIFQMKIRKVGTDGVDGILKGRQAQVSPVDDDLNSFHSARSSDNESGRSSSVYADAQEVADAENKRKASQYLDNASAARMDAIATIVNLACAEENKIKLLRHPGMLDAVIHVAHHDTIDDAREHASIVLMNLALAEDNKVRAWEDIGPFIGEMIDYSF